MNVFVNEFREMVNLSFCSIHGLQLCRNEDREGENGSQNLSHFPNMEHRGLVELISRSECFGPGTTEVYIPRIKQILQPVERDATFSRKRRKFFCFLPDDYINLCQ